MCAFARSEIELSKPQEDGNPLRVHLELHKKHSKEHIPLLDDATPLPLAAVHLWNYFCELRSERTPDQRITAAAIRDIEWLHGVDLLLWERQAIKKLDRVFSELRQNDRRNS